METIIISNKNRKTKTVNDVTDKTDDLQKALPSVKITIYNKHTLTHIISIMRQNNCKKTSSRRNLKPNISFKISFEVWEEEQDLHRNI